jgi:anti-sigma-K factor RskA
MLLYAADALDEAERGALRAHLASGCPRCAGALAEAQATVAHLPMALDQHLPPADARDRLMRRVVADAASSRSAGPAGRARGIWLTLGAAAAVVLVVVGVTMRSITGNYRQRLAQVENAAEQARQDALQAQAASAAMRIELAHIRDENVQLRNVAALLGSSNLDMVKLASDQTSARGRIFWDRDKGKWHVQVFDLKPPPEGREFELWFITPDQRKLPAGTFRVDASGKGVHEVDVPKDIGPIALAAITDEPIGGALQPTGSIHLAGKVQ